MTSLRFPIVDAIDSSRLDTIRAYVAWVAEICRSTKGRPEDRVARQRAVKVREVGRDIDIEPRQTREDRRVSWLYS